MVLCHIGTCACCWCGCTSWYQTFDDCLSDLFQHPRRVQMGFGWGQSQRGCRYKEKMHCGQQVQFHWLQKEYGCEELGWYRLVVTAAWLELGVGEVKEQFQCLRWHCSFCVASVGMFQHCLYLHPPIVGNMGDGYRSCIELHQMLHVMRLLFCTRCCPQTRCFLF